MCIRDSYTAGPIHINFSAPHSVGVGIGTTAFATASITNGSVSSVSIVNSGLGYTFTSPPQVIVQHPQLLTERVIEYENVEGYTGIITGITTSTGINGHSTALKFFFRAQPAGRNAASLITGYPVLITDTKVGTGVTSVVNTDGDIVGIGTCLLYTSPSPRDRTRSRMPSSA